MNKKYKRICGILLSLAIILILFLVYYKTKKFTVIFDTRGSTPYKYITIKPNERVTKPADPVMEGYTFIGWYIDNELYDFSKPVREDLTIYAHFEQISISE